MTEVTWSFGGLIVGGNTAAEMVAGGALEGTIGVGFGIDGEANIGGNQTIILFEPSFNIGPMISINQEGLGFALQYVTTTGSINLVGRFGSLTVTDNLGHLPGTGPLQATLPYGTQNLLQLAQSVLGTTNSSSTSDVVQNGFMGSVGTYTDAFGNTVNLLSFPDAFSSGTMAVQYAGDTGLSGPTSNSDDSLSATNISPSEANTLNTLNLALPVDWSGDQPFYQAIGYLNNSVFQSAFDDQSILEQTTSSDTNNSVTFSTDGTPTQYVGATGLNVISNALSDDSDDLSSPSSNQGQPADAMSDLAFAGNAEPVGYIQAAAYQTAVDNAAVYGPQTNQSAYTSDSFTDGSFGGSGGSGGVGGGGFGFGGGGGGSGGGGSPIVLDVAALLGLPDQGIKITPLSSSNTFFDMSGSGHQNLTAWAGAGNGVLFYDPTGEGQLTQEKQIVFTDWDPGATSDMQALEDVFDTNHDGSLDSSDTDFDDFFLMVTNANGTQTAYSLAQLGITSINLTANAVNIDLPDGSSIDGETTYTTSSDGTGTAATVTFATASGGYAVSTTSATNTDGSETVTNVALNADGSVAFTQILNTLISGDVTSKVLTYLNAGGVVTSIQTDVIDGSTENLTNYANGAVTSTGELTDAGTAGFEELNSTVTTTAALSGGSQITILRDQTGGGWTSQEEVDTYNSSGLLSSTVVSDLNPNGSESSVETTTMTYASNGSTRTTTTLVDDISADSTTTVDQIVLDAGTETETVTDSAGTTVVGLVTTVTQTTSNTVTQTTTSDFADGSTLDLTSVSQTTTGSGDSTTTQTDTSANGTLLDETITTQTPQSSGGLITVATSSELDGYNNFIETGSSTTTVSNAGATATTTVVDDSANGTLRSETVTTGTVGSPAGSVITYGNGDGAITLSQTVTVSGTTTTDTTENLNADGSLISETVTVTSAGGLSKTTYTDSTGAGTASDPVFDHITTDVTTTSGGSSIETVTDYGASTSYEIGQTQTVVSANGLTTTTYNAFTSASLAAGSWDQISADQTTVNADGSLSETTTVTNGAGDVLETVQKNTSANRQVVTTTTTLGATDLVETVETVTTESNGSIQDQVVHLDQQGDVIGAAVTTTSADGLSQTVQNDIQGQSAATYAASGLAFDKTSTATTVINADGSRTETTNVTSQNGTLLSTISQLTSANSLSVTITSDPYATTNFYATDTSDVTVYNSDGSQTETITDDSYNGTLIDQITTTTSADGLAKTTLYDFGGGATDRSTTDDTTINPDGSLTETITNYTGGTNGTVQNVTVTHSGIIVTGAGLETITTQESFGSVPTYSVETITPSANGTTTDTTQYYAQPGGSLLLQTQVITSANGLVKTTGTAVNGDTTNDFWTIDSTVLNAGGSQTETTANFNSAGLISETVTTTSANGLSQMVQTDANGAESGSNPVFNFTTTENTVLNGNGSRTETDTAINANGGTIEETVATTSADQQTVTTDRYLDETGNIETIDQSETVQTQANGSTSDTTISYDASHNLLDTVTKATSGNGLVMSTQYENGGGTVVDTQTDTTTYDSDGDGGTTEIFQDTDNLVSGVTATTTRTTQTTGNGENTTITLALSATSMASFSAVADESVTIANTGIETQTTTDTINGASSAADTTTVVTSANQLTTTTSTALGSSSPYILQQTSTAPDGSKSQVTTYYDPGSLSTIEEQTTVDTSADGRTITTTQEANYDGLNQTTSVLTHYGRGYEWQQVTPVFNGTGYSVETDTFVQNVNGTTTESRSGTGSFAAPSYAETIDNFTNADSSLTTTIADYDGTGALIAQIVADVSADGLTKTYAYDASGQETIADLEVVAADLISGASLPTSIPDTDIIESDVTTLNLDGSKTEVVETGYGNSFANLRSQTTAFTSANGLVTTTYVDNNGDELNGVAIYDQVDTLTIAPDGSTNEVFDYYSDTSGTEQMGSMLVGSTLVSTKTSTVSADGLVTTLVTSQGLTETTIDFANSNGSYEWSESGAASASASHLIDANGIDTWTYGSSVITIDVATENQDIAIANEIYQTLLGRQMDDAETQYLAQYISDGILDRESLATAIVVSSEYVDEYVAPYTTVAPHYYGINIITALQNALGRLPTAEEMATFDADGVESYNAYGAEYGIGVPSIAVAIAQYAMDQGAGTLATISANQALTLSASAYESSAANATDISSGTYSYTGTVLVAQGSSTTVNGNNNVILSDTGSDALSVTGFDDAVDVAGTANVTASNAAILAEYNASATISGNNNQIGVYGADEVTLTSGTGDVIYVLWYAVYEPGYSIQDLTTTNASNAQIAIAAGDGTSNDPEIINGNNDAVSLGASAYLTLNGSSDSIAVGSSAIVVATGTSNVFTVGSSTSAEIQASGSGNTLEAGSGTSTLIDSGSSSFYQFALGDGQATIVNGSSSNGAASNELNFGSGISDEQLWFQQSGNNLQIDLIGSNSQITVENWFASAGNQLQEITAGGVEIDSQVSQLVQAMATYAANNPSFNPATASQMPNDPTLQSAIAAAWHH